MYDAGSDRVVVADRGRGLWAYDADADTWVELQPPSPSPCELFGQPIAYDARADRIVLSGQGELCVYDLDTNTLIARPRGGVPDEVSAVAYDQQSGLVVMLGDGLCLSHTLGPAGTGWPDRRWCLVAERGHGLSPHLRPDGDLRRCPHMGLPPRLRPMGAAGALTRMAAGQAGSGRVRGLTT